MAYVTSTKHTALRAMPLISRLDEIATKINAELETRRIFRQTLRELQDLSTRDLADLGMNPSNLRQIAWQTAQDIAEDRKPV